jgi:two-component system, LytTR family, response regulator
MGERPVSIYPVYLKEIFLKTPSLQMPPKMKCLIVDDNEIDRLTLSAFLEQYDFIEIAAIFDSPKMVLEASGAIKPDILFLDIDMPEMSGLQLRKHLPDIPVCIFITSFPDYALESFEMAAMDYLVKPFSSDRFSKTMGRIKEYMEIRYQSDLFSHTMSSDVIYIKSGHGQVKLDIKEVIYLEALNNYTSLVTKDRKFMVLSSLGNLLNEKSFRRFLRIHRSYAIQKQFIQKINAGEVIVNKISLPVGRTYKDALHAINR